LLSNLLENFQLSFFDRTKRQIPAFLPKQIEFKTISCARSIHYEWTREKKVSLVDSGNVLTISGNLQRILVKKSLNQWISKQAKLYFVPELKKLSEKTELTYSNLRFKNTKTRWGSCSDKKTINLNIQLLFLPKHLSDQVMLHELCHLKHLNHSKDFWNLVASFEPNFKALERELKHNGRKYIPGWILRR